MQQLTEEFVVIDDDRINNIICVKMIQGAFPSAKVQTFMDPQQGLEHILGNCEAGSATQATIFLDINMPVLSGWDVLEQLVTLPESARNHLAVFMLSSSVDPLDMQKANGYSIVSGYLVKPLSIAKLQNLFP